MLAAGLLDEIDGRRQLGEQHRQDLGRAHPLERLVHVHAQDELLDGEPQPQPVGLGETGGVLAGELGDGLGGPPAVVGDGTCQLEEDDRIGLDEPAYAIGSVSGHGPGYLPRVVDKFGALTRLGMDGAESLDGCKVVLQSASFRWPSVAFPESRDSTLRSTPSRRHSYSSSGRSKAAMPPSRVVGSVVVPSAFRTTI